MLVPVQDREQVKAILRDIEARFAALALFGAGRREIVEACVQYARAVCDWIVDVNRMSGWLDASSPHLGQASRLLLVVTRTFRTILPVMARASPGIGTPSAEAARVALELAKPVAVITRALRYMLKRGAWGSAFYDDGAREMVLDAPGDEIQLRESFNAARIRRAEEWTLRAGLQRPISAEAEPADLHRSGIERLHPAYTKSAFGAVMRVIRESAISQAGALGLCSIAEADRANLEHEIANRSGVAVGEVSAVLSDLVFVFDPEQDGEQFLLELVGGRVATIPLLVVERKYDETEYLRISKTRYPAAYSAHQQALTRSLEDRAGDALRAHAPRAEVRPLDLPGGFVGGVGGQVDRVASEAEDDALLLVQVKYLLDHDNARIAEGVRQLRRDESVIRKCWSEVSEHLKGWRGRAFPGCLGKLLVTNWFLGTEATPTDIRVVSVADLAAIPPAGSVRTLIRELTALPEPKLWATHETRASLFGYTFVYHTTDA